ncbi:hypothetical protein QT970_17645, partial [Microcoleus sp. herbarium8]
LIRGGLGWGKKLYDSCKDCYISFLKFTFIELSKFLSYFWDDLLSIFKTLISHLPLKDCRTDCDLLNCMIVFNSELKTTIAVLKRGEICPMPGLAYTG